MGLETGSFIADFVLTNPVTSDLVSEGDDHIRLIKTAVQSTFPGMGGVFSRVDARSTAYTILATDNTRHFVIDNSACATVTLSLPAAASITSGYSVMITARAGATVLIDGNASEQINGATTLTLGDVNCAHVFFVSSAAGWRANVYPTGESGHIFHGTLGVSASASFNAPVRFSATCSFASILHIDAGQLQFPAVQNASAGANVLDDYEEGTWTPTITFDTPGDLSVTYDRQVGAYTKIGRIVHATFTLDTATFTHTTAAGSMRISGLPFTPATGPNHAAAVGAVTGISISSAATVVMEVETGTATLLVRKNASGLTSAPVDVTNHSSGLECVLTGQLTYYV